MNYNELNTIFLGADLCLEKNITADRMRQLVNKMYNCGLRLVRLYPYWAHIEEVEGKYRLEAYDACFKEAEKLGMKVFFTFKPNSPPWWMKLTSSYNLDDYQFLEEPEYMEKFLKYVRHVVNRYKDEKSLIAWCVWNEPRIKPPETLGKFALEEYRKFLSSQYDGDISKLNQLYFMQYTSFDEIMPLKQFYRSDMPEKTDFLRFCTDTLARIIGKISDEIKKLDPVHPTHMNTHSAEAQHLLLSHNIWKQTKAVDFPGLSVYPKFTSDWPGSAFVNAFYMTFMRSASKGIYWITELQGGPAIYTYTVNGISSPDPSDLKLALWDYFGGGAKACVFWSFTPTIRGEWALLGLNDSETERMTAVNEVFQCIEKNRALLESTTPEEPDVYILVSEASLIHDTILDKGVEYINSLTHAHAQIGAHNLFLKMGYVSKFVDEELFMEEGVPENAIIIAPSCTALQHKTVAAIEKFVENGGTLISDSLFAWKEEHCLISSENIKLTNRIFGAEWIDIHNIGKDAEIVFSDEEKKYPPLFTKSVYKNETDVICYYRTGEPAVLCNKYGKGKAVRFTTEIFRSSLCHDMGGAMECLKDYLPKNRQNKIWLSNSEDKFYMHILHSEEAKILVIVNYSEEPKQAVLCGCDKEKLFDLETHETVKCNEITVSPRNVRLLMV
ncbi:MAG: hypothetical protein E7406_09445 [Ruminococcaceae bacterium]|nr:hypothetical protein [Oscillospiraceae bacterium]